MSEVIDFLPKLPEGHLDTEVHSKTTYAGQDTRRNRYMMTVRGPTGIGKTYACDQLRRGYEDATVKLTLSRDAGSMTAGAAALRRAFSPLIDGPYNPYGAPENHRPAKVLIELRKFCRRFWDHNGTAILLIIDEFQFAQPLLQDLVRSLWDAEHAGQVGLFGLVLCGNTRLFNPVKGKMTEVDFSPVIRRCRHVLDFPVTPPGDTEALMAHYRIAGAESKRLLAACGELGGLGEMINVIQKGQEIGGTPLVALKHLKAAAATTGLSGATWLRQRR